MIEWLMSIFVDHEQTFVFSQSFMYYLDKYSQTWSSRTL